MMIFARPAATDLPTSTSLSFSGSVSVLVSPVVAVTTMPSAPALMTSSMCFSTPGQSTSPSAVNGVTRATSTWPNGFSRVLTTYRVSRRPPPPLLRPSRSRSRPRPSRPPAASPASYPASPEPVSRSFCPPALQFVGIRPPRRQFLREMGQVRPVRSWRVRTSQDAVRTERVRTERVRSRGQSGSQVVTAGQRGQDRPQHVVPVIDDLVVVEPQHPVPAHTQAGVALHVRHGSW